MYTAKQIFPSHCCNIIHTHHIVLLIEHRATCERHASKSSVFFQLPASKLAMEALIAKLNEWWHYSLRTWAHTLESSSRTIARKWNLVLITCRPIVSCCQEVPRSASSLCFVDKSTCSCGCRCVYIHDCTWSFPPPVSKYLGELF